MSKGKRSALLGILLLPILAILVSEFTYVPRVAPPAEATNFSAFLRSRADIYRIERLELGGSNYVMVTGTAPFSIHAPSGPPIYVFSAGGELVDWAGEEGDATEFNNWWDKVSNVVSISMEEAFSSTGGQKETAGQGMRD